MILFARCLPSSNTPRKLFDYLENSFEGFPESSGIGWDNLGQFLGDSWPDSSEHERRCAMMYTTMLKEIQ